VTTAPQAKSLCHKGIHHGALVWSTEQRTSRGSDAEKIERLARQALEGAGQR
jgi:hypothetical protein